MVYVSGYECSNIFFGDRVVAFQSLLAGAFLPLVATLVIVLRIDTFLPSVKDVLWIGAVVFALVLAVYAGKNYGGMLISWFVVFAAVFWGYVVPPLVAHAQGDTFGDRPFTTPRPSAVGLEPRAELLVGLEFGSMVALAVALVFGTGCFILGTLLGSNKEVQQCP